MNSSSLVKSTRSKAERAIADLSKPSEEKRLAIAKATRESLYKVVDHRTTAAYVFSLFLTDPV